MRKATQHLAYGATLGLLLMAPAASVANVSQGPKPWEDRFSEADIVCRCVVQTVLKEDPSRNSAPAQGVDYRVAADALSLFKGPAGVSRLTVEFRGRDPDWGAPLQANRSYVLFLKSIAHGRYELIAPEGSVIDLTRSEVANLNFAGPSALEASIRGELRASNNGPAVRDLLLMLLQFRDLSQETLYSVDQLNLGALSPVADLLRLEVLADKGSPSGPFISQLIAALLKQQAKNPTENLPDSIGGDGFSKIFDTIAARSTQKDLQNLRLLGDCPANSLRLSAMFATRRLRDTSSVPFLIHKLDDSDRLVQYEAVITLAEITGKSGDFGPGMGPFEQNPEKYVWLWKDWWLTGDK